jgi:hypothetical protein
MKTKLLALALLTAGSMFAETHLSFGIGIGGYAPGYYAPPPPSVAPPGPGFVWVNGAWVRRPYRTYWGAPRYEQYRYYRGRDWDRRRDWDRDRGYWRR